MISHIAVEVYFILLSAPFFVQLHIYLTRFEEKKNKRQNKTSWDVVLCIVKGASNSIKN